MVLPASLPAVSGVEADASDTGINPVIVDARVSRGASLVCVSGDELGRTFRLDDRPLEIGRARDGIALRSSDVSRRHARIYRDVDGFVLEDLHSANGTYLNGERVTAPMVLRMGDRLQIGTTILVFSHYDELQERMDHLQRLEAMGTLAGGIAHDFNNALAVILMNLDLVEEGVPGSETMAREGLEAIRSATVSASSLAKRLLRLGSRDPLTIGVVGLDALMEQTLRLVRRRATAQIALAIEIEPGLRVLGSFDELQQVLINLYYNSVDAMPEGGTFTVRARSVTFDTNGALDHQLEIAGDYVEIEVRDSGTGMDAATRARLFEPFFTTKPRGKGTGLGLAMIHGSVRRHGGSITVESELGAGTTFRMYLHHRA